MPKQLTCPRCQAAIPPPASPEAEHVQCPACGARFRIRKSPSTPPATPKPGPAAAAPVTAAPSQDKSTATRIVVEDRELATPTKNIAAPVAASGGDDDYHVAAPTVPEYQPRRPIARDDRPALPGKPGLPAKHGLPGLPQHLRPAPADKKTSGKLDPRVMIAIGGGAAAVLVLLAVSAVVFVRLMMGGRGGEGLAGGNSESGESKQAPLSATAVVFDQPLEGITPVPAGTTPIASQRAPVDPSSVWTAIAILPPAASEAVIADPARGPWSAQPDPAPTQPLSLPPGYTLYVNTRPILAARGGPFLVQEHQGSARTNLLFGEKPNVTPTPVYDLRTGEKAGGYAWDAPLWWPVRLSPDAMYLVGAENTKDMAQTREGGHLFIWKRDTEKPSGSFKVPGPVIWMDFVTADAVALLTFSPEPVLQLWDVAKAELKHSLSLPKEEFSPPTRDPFLFDKATGKTFAPSPWIGTISAGGRYLYLAGASGVVAVSLADGQIAGSLPLPGKFQPRPRPPDDPRPPEYPGRGEFRGMSITEDGSTLHALVRTDHLHLVSWSLASGLSTRAVAIGKPDQSRRFLGPPLTGPTPETLILATRSADASLIPHFEPWNNSGAVVDIRTGAVMLELSYLPLRWGDGQRLLAVGQLGAVPQILLPPKVRDEDVSSLNAELLIKRRDNYAAAFSISLNEPGSKPPPGGAHEPRPPVKTADRAGVAPITPSPPAEWTAPPTPPATSEKLLGAAPIPATRPLLGNAHAAFLHGWVSLDGHVNGQYAFPEGIHWHRYDLRTAKAAGPPITLWPWTTSPETGKGMNLGETMVAAALSPDGKRLALRDPAELARVDVWEESGEQIMGLAPYGPSAAIQWVGWSASGRLLTIGGGKLTAWDVPSGAAAFEVAGDYRLPVATVRGRGWLAIAAGDHVDLVEADTGKCLGRLPLAGAKLPDTLPDMAVSPDGKLLVYCGQRPDDDPARPKPHLDAVLLAWDLATGKAHEPLPVERVPGWSIVAVDEHRVLAGMRLVDLRSRAAVATYSCHCLADSPDGRLWGLGPDPTRQDAERRPWESRPGQPWNPAADPKVALLPVELVAMDSGPASPQEIFTRDVPLTVEVDLRKPQRGEELGRQQLELLQKKGYSIGKSQWRLVASAEAFDSGNQFTNKLPIPALRLHWRFLTPEGTESWKHEKMFFFEQVEDKFQVSQRRTRTKGPLAEDVIEEKYDFGGNPYEVIVEALLDKAASYVTVEAFPQQTGKFNGKYQELPAQGEVRFGLLSE